MKSQGLGYFTLLKSVISNILSDIGVFLYIFRIVKTYYSLIPVELFYSQWLTAESFPQSTNYRWHLRHSNHKPAMQLKFKLLNNIDLHEGVNM